jgi:hypothetical protein
VTDEARAWLGRGRPRYDGPREFVISTSIGWLRVSECHLCVVGGDGPRELNTSGTLRGRTLDQPGGWPDIDKDGPDGH